MAITTASPAYDFTATCPLATDQRGVTRPQGTACDIGAYETDTIAPTLISFTRQIPATSPTNADTLVFRATFDEPVINVSVGDFLVSGTTTATVTNVGTISTTVYDITVSREPARFYGTCCQPLGAKLQIQVESLPAGDPAIDEVYLVTYRTIHDQQSQHSARPEQDHHGQYV
jgi:hypothetical protein